MIYGKIIKNFGIMTVQFTLIMMMLIIYYQYKINAELDCIQLIIMLMV